MATRTISTRIAVEGEAEYKSSMSAINNELKLLQSSLKLSSSEFAGSQNSMEALTAKGESLSAVYAAQQQKVATLTEALSNAKSAQDDWSARVADSQTALDSASQAVSGMDDATRAAGEQWNSYSSDLKSAEDKLKAMQESSADTTEEEARLTAQIEKLKSKLNTLNSETDGAAQSAGELLAEQTRLTNELQLNEAGYQASTRAVTSWQNQLATANTTVANLANEIDQNNQYLDEAQSSADGCASSIDQFGRATHAASDDASEGSEAVGGMGQSMDALGSILMTAGIAAMIQEIGQAMGDCMEASMEFGAAMSQVAATMGTSVDQIGELTATAKELGATTSFTATQAAEGLNILAQSGLNAADQMAILPSVLSLASAGSMSMDASASALVTTLNGFSTYGYTAADVADAIAKGSTMANTSVSQLGEGLASASASASTYGQDLVTTETALLALAQAGEQGSAASTALNAAMKNLYSPTDVAAAALQELGVSAYDSSGAAGNFMETVYQLNSALAGYSDQQKSAYLDTIFGIQGVEAYNKITATSKDTVDSWTTSVQEAGGAAEQMADTQLDNAAGKVTLLESAFSGLQIEIGDQLSPAFAVLVDIGSEALTWLTEFLDENEEVVPIITGVVVALGIFLTAVTVSTTAVQLFTLATTTLGASAAPVIAIIGAVAAGVGLLSAVFISSGADAAQASQQYATAIETVKASADAYAASSADLDATTDSTRNLIATLNDLMAQEEKDAATKETIQGIVNQLNTSMPELGLTYDSLTDSLSMTNEELQDYADNVAAAAEVEVLKNRMMDLIDESYELADALETQKEELTSNTKAMESNGIAGMIATAQNEKLQKRIEELTEASEENAEQQDELKVKLNDAAAAMDDGAESADAMSESTEALGAAASSTGEKVLSASEEITLAYAEAMQSGADSIDGQVGKWYELDEKASHSMKNLLKSMAQYQEDVSNYYANLTYVAENYGQSIATLYADGSADSMEYVSILTNATETQKAKYIELAQSTQATTAEISTRFAAMEESVTGSLDGVSTSAADAGTATTDAYTDGIMDGESKINDAASTVAESGTEAMDQTASSTQAGATNTTSYAAGVTSQSSSAVSAASNVSAAAAVAANKSSAFYQSGVNSVNGFINGVNSKMSSAAAVATRLGNTFLSNFRASVGEASPWKTTMASGAFAVEGLATGVESALPLAGASAEALGESFVSVLGSSMGGAAIDFSATTSGGTGRNRANRATGSSSAQGLGQVITLQLADSAGRIIARTTQAPLDKINGSVVALQSRGLAR